MATSKTKSTDAPAEGAKTRKGQPRPSAVIGDLDFGGVDESRLTPDNVRRTVWDDTLDKLYDATVAGKVGRDEAGALKWVKIGDYSSGQGAKAQVKSFRKRGLDSTYEFKVSGKELFARVIETA